MSPKELDAGKRWVERRFTEIADELNVPATLATQARWSESRATSQEQRQCLGYEITVQGQRRRGEAVLRDVDLEDVGCGEKVAQDELEREIRRLLESFQSK